MSRFTSRLAAVPLVLLLLPSAAFAQFAGAITGVAKDASGGVLPGVTVEAASPALIEKVRSVVTDDTGQYRIVDLRPGTYSVTFSLPGFSSVKRDGIEMTGSFVATVNGELKVGALEETITVTGETPVVDVQSAKVQQTVSNDVIRAIPTSRSAGGIQALIPGLSGNGDSGGITGGGGTRRDDPRGRGTDSRTYNDGLNVGWAGGGGGLWGNMLNVAAAQEVVLSTSGGLGEAETAGVTLNAIPREGGNMFSGTLFANGASGAHAGQQLHAVPAKTRGSRRRRNSKALRVQSDGRRPDHPRQAVVLHLVPPDLDGQHGPRHVGEQERRQPERLDGGFRQEPAGVSETLDRILTARVTWQATPRNKINVSWQEQIYHRNWKGGGTATHDDRSDEPRLVRTVPAAGGHLVVADHRAGCWRRRAGARISRATAIRAPRIDGTFNPQMIRAQEQARRDPEPDLPRSPPASAAATTII